MMTLVMVTVKLASGQFIQINDDACAAGLSSVESLGSENEEEVFGCSDRIEEILVEFSRFQFLDVDENCETAKLQMHFEQTRQLRPV